MEDNIISLVQHIQKKEDVQTYNQFDHFPVNLTKESLTQRRIYSFLVDFGTISVFSAAINTSYSLFISEFLYGLKYQVKSSLIADNFMVSASIFVLTYFTYFLYSLYVMDGQTFGKKVFNLVTINDDYYHEDESRDSGVEFRQTFKRAFGYLTCYLSFGTFFIFSLMSEDKRGLPDYFSQTRTVSTEWLSSMQAYRSNSGEVVQIDIQALDKTAA